MKEPQRAMTFCMSGNCLLHQIRDEPNWTPNLNHHWYDFDMRELDSARTCYY